MSILVARYEISCTYSRTSCDRSLASISDFLRIDTPPRLSVALSTEPRKSRLREGTPPRGCPVPILNSRMELSLTSKNLCSILPASGTSAERSTTISSPGTPTASVVEDGVAMHDLGSAKEITARLPAVTQGSARSIEGKEEQVLSSRSPENTDANEKHPRPSRAKPYPNRRHLDQRGGTARRHRPGFTAPAPHSRIDPVPRRGPTLQPPASNHAKLSKPRTKINELVRNRNIWHN